MKILLIMPTPDPPNWFTEAVGKVAQPLVTTYLAGLTPPEYEVSALDMNAGDVVTFKEDADVVGITVRTPSAETAYDIADKFLAGGKHVVLGGAHVTIHPEEAKQHSTSVVLGEAENVWQQVLRDCDRGTPKSFYVGGPFDVSHLQGEIFQIKERSPFKNLPLCDRNVLPRRRYRFDTIFTSQGCPYGCNFCSVGLLNGRRERHRPLAEVIEEVKTLRNAFWLLDNNMLGTPKMHAYYQELYRNIAKISKKYRWMGEGSLNAVHNESGRQTLALAAKSGLTLMHVGIECISSSSNMQAGTLLKNHAKRQEDYDRKESEEALKIIKKLGIVVIGCFIVGFDNDRPDTLDEISSFCRKNSIIPNISLLQPFPGSKIHNDFSKRGILKEDCQWADYGKRGSFVFQHPSGQAMEIERRYRSVLERDYSKKAILKRGFQNFTEHMSPVKAFYALGPQLGMRRALPYV
jgi:radical SAM superfamily enzyme YgiQ (UPF0313 family)